ncbi:ATP-dependent Clp protease proteolytic subunit, partial [Phyllobacterium sp. P5_D12]
MKRIVAAFAAAALASTSHAATFTSISDKILLMDGEIVEGDNVRLIAAVTAANEAGNAIQSLLLNSPGGNVGAGVKLAYAVHLLGLKTAVASGDRCNSMCPLVWAAGAKRYHMAGARIGVHSASTYQEASEGGEVMPYEGESAKATTLEMARLAKLYGMPDSVIAKMVTTPGDQMAWLNSDEVAGFSEFISDTRKEEAMRPPTTTAAIVPVLPKPSYVPDRSEWTMTCQSATSGKTYEVSLFNNGKIVVGPNTYSYDGNWAKNGAGSYLAKGKTRYGHFVAVFHSTSPQPYIAFVNNKGERVKDWCR